MNFANHVKFIELVEKHQFLYNKRSGCYKRSDLKMKKWQEIAVQMGYEDIRCFKKMEKPTGQIQSIKKIIIKTCLVLLARKIPKLSGSCIPIHMQFLDEFTQQRKHVGRYYRFLLSVDNETERPQMVNRLHRQYPRHRQYSRYRLHHHHEVHCRVHQQRDVYEEVVLH
ncbi:hypothetical protein ABEB36_000490 [Hypothenemus hampei]|uniref:MADF domain-containing protein n=1 Tax=Hypothenemus hampei TaxID=57062 RepID=A0ABD1FBI3_HYPHA